MDDPMLPERLHAARVRRGVVAIVVLVLLAIVSFDSLLWSLPLTIVSLMVAAFPLRRALFGETWSLAAYASFCIRLSVGVWGFWLLLTVSPWIASTAGALDWIVALLLGALLLVLNARYAEFLRFILNVRPVDSPVLTMRFRALVEKSGMPPPRFDCVPLDGGLIANALALPSERQSSVLFSETLLERLEPDETVAICAHELAHLEHFNRAFLRRLNIENNLLIVSASLVVPISRLAALSSIVYLTALWLLALAAVLTRRAKDRQRQETASDLRAVQLGGDPEALIRGLTRLYTMARLPRRFDQQREQQATHPSLARRIRDIRAAAGMAAGTLGTSATFASSDGLTSVTFNEDSVSWSEGEAATHTLKYGYLSELRAQARGSHPPTLVAVERAGRRWEMTLANEDLVRVQSVLDVVDGRLAEPGPPPSMWPKLDRTMIVVGAMVGLAAGQLGMALVALLAMIQPSAPLLAAAGIASMAAGAVVFRGGAFDGLPFPELGVMLVGFGVVLLLVARSKRNETVSTRATIAVASLGMFAALAVMMFLLGGMDPVRLHQSGQSVTSAPVLLLAFAGALTLWRSRRAKYAAIPVMMVAAATTGVASTSFLDRFGEDIFISPAPSIEWTAATGPVVREFTIPFTGDTLQLSPRGTLVAVGQTGYTGGQEAETRFHIGAEDRVTTVAAVDLLFLDEERVLIARPAGDGVELSEADARSPEHATWRVQIPGINNPQLSFDSTSGRWSVLGWTAHRGVVAASGSPGSPDMHRQQWTSKTLNDGWVKSFAAADERLLVVETSYKPGFLQRCGLWHLAWLVQPDLETRFRFASTQQDHTVMVSRLDATCFTGGLKGQNLVCSAFDGTRTRFISLNAASSQVHALGWVDGRYTFNRRPNNGWFSGWRNSSPVALSLQRRIGIEGDRVSNYRPFVVTGADDVIGMMSFDGTGSTIRLIRLSNAESSAARVIE